MILTLDLFREDGCAAVCADGMPRNGFTFPCFPPWKVCRLDTPEEETAFSGFLKRLVSFLKGEYGEELQYITFLVPFDFSHLQRARLRKIAGALGAGICSIGYGIEYQALCCAEKEDVVFFGQIESDRIEFGAADIFDGVYDIRGVNGIRVSRDDRTDKAQARLATEVRQFLRDIGAETGEKGKDIVYVSGTSSDPAVSWLGDAFGRTPVPMPNNGVKGAVMQGLCRCGKLGDVILLQTVPAAFSLALGENGERGTVIPQYCQYPTRRGIRLLVSTETTLHIYEGNYLNPRFDTEIGSLSLAEIPEGHEAECVLNMDSRGKILLTVRNEQGKTLVEKDLDEVC